MEQPSDRTDPPSTTCCTQADRMSVRSATLSLYKSEESLERGVGNMAGMGGVGGPPTTCNGKSLPASPFIRRPSKSNSFHSHVRLPEKYDCKKPLVLFTYLDAQGTTMLLYINS